jgi:hypothetical protein
MPALRALSTQLIAALLTLLFVWGLSRSPWALPPLWALALLQGAIAAIVAWRTGADRWWLPLHLSFMPAIVLAQRLPLPPAAYLALLGILLLVYGMPFRSQVPLYLTNDRTLEVLLQWLPNRPLRVLDIGSGTGRFVLRLARRRADCQVTGIEWALLPWWLSRWSARALPNARLLREDFRRHPLGGYDVVYAFLAPVAMASLWDKACREMAAGSWLISNSFPVPQQAATEHRVVGDRRGTRLYCYRIPQRASGGIVRVVEDGPDATR